MSSLISHAPNSTFCDRKHGADLIPPHAIAFDIYRVWAQLNVIILFTQVETNSIKGDLKLWAHSNHSAREGFKNTIPFKLNCKQLCLGVRLKDAHTDKINKD